MWIIVEDQALYPSSTDMLHDESNTFLHVLHDSVYRALI